MDLKRFSCFVRMAIRDNFGQISRNESVGICRVRRHRLLFRVYVKGIALGEGKRVALSTILSILA